VLELGHCTLGHFEPPGESGLTISLTVPEFVEPDLRERLGSGLGQAVLGSGARVHFFAQLGELRSRHQITTPDTRS
jgi:hypothetical protein